MNRKQAISAVIMIAGTCLVAGLAAPPVEADYIDTVMSYNPLAYWRLSEDSGPTACDSVGGQHGTYHGGIGLGEPSFLSDDTAARFWVNGKRGYVEVPHADSLLLDDGTVNFWFKDTGTIRKAGLFTKDSRGYDSGGHLTIMTDHGRLKVRLQSTTNSYFLKSGPLALDTWYNAAFTFGSKGMQLYLDGVPVASNPYAGGLGSTSGGAGNYEPLVFGANTRLSGDLVSFPRSNYYSGLIDEAALFDNALAPDDIHAICDARIPEPGPLLLFIAGCLAFARRLRG
ncbi:MAG: LamG domain-containing protein [Phycisphaerae bacterium]|nr:LamG domain-containing protein [Phycisphaerae bacterium]